MIQSLTTCSSCPMNLSIASRFGVCASMGTILTRLAPQIIVGLIQPVFPRRIEVVDVDCVFERQRGMRDIWRNAQAFSTADRYFLAFNGELQCSRFDVRHLLVIVMMHR